MEASESGSGSEREADDSEGELMESQASGSMDDDAQADNRRSDRNHAGMESEESVDMGLTDGSDDEF